VFTGHVYRQVRLTRATSPGYGASVE
jgi:hypothetical protein